MARLKPVVCEDGKNEAAVSKNGDVEKNNHANEGKETLSKITEENWRSARTKKNRALKLTVYVSTGVTLLYVAIVLIIVTSLNRAAHEYTTQVDRTAPNAPKIVGEAKKTTNQLALTNTKGRYDLEPAVWIKAEYIPGIHSDSLAWNILSFNDGPKNITLDPSGKVLSMPENGRYSVLATFQINGQFCTRIRNARHASVRFCILHNQIQLKCTVEAFPLANVDYWIHTTQLYVPVIQMEEGDTVKFVSSNPKCIYEDPQVSMLEINKIT